MSVLQNINGTLYRMDASDLAQLAAVDTKGILGGTPGATTNGQTLVDQLAADDAQAQTDIGQIKTDLPNLFPRSEQRILGAKNNLANKATGTTKDNIVFVVNSDGSITANGTAASPAVQYATLSITGGVVPNVWKGMKLSGCVNGSSSTHNYNVAYFNTQTGTQVTNDIVYTDGYTIKDYDYINIFARVVAGAQVTNATWKPMIRLASDPDDTYVPYVMTNRELTEKKVDILKRTLKSSDDLNNIIETGIYSASTTPSNAPDNQSYFSMFVFGNNEISVVRQIIYGSSGASSAIYTRTYSAGTWKSWVKFTGTVVS